MRSRVKEYAADHRLLREAVARKVGFADAVAINLSQFETPLLKAARKGPVAPIDDVLVRDWDPDNRRLSPGIQQGMRLYEIEGIQFVRVRFSVDEYERGHDFVLVDRKNYTKFYQIAFRCRRNSEPLAPAPILPQERLDSLWQNTIGYLDPDNLQRIKVYGGRARRGLLLTGPPGNGKTMACRWIWEECRKRAWEWRLVTPEAYQEARDGRNAIEGVRNLFAVERRGIVFFDDMDLALRDRETVHETDDQSIFLTALDGISVNEGVVFVFTTNCGIELIDKAFKRPGRLDLILQFQPPDRLLRRRLMERWHADIRTSLDLDKAVATTEGFSFAEIEELKNLLILHFMDKGAWNWQWALKQFAVNRKELTPNSNRCLGFGPSPSQSLLTAAANGV